MRVDTRDLLLLQKIPGVGPQRLRSLIHHFAATGPISTATIRDLAAVEGLDRKTAQTLVGFFRDGGPERLKSIIDEQFVRLEKAGGRIISLWDTDYPENLKKIYDPPPLLFCLGESDDSDRYSVAIVGTRHPSPYGESLATRFATGFSQLGLAVVSGLARGIDTLAHQTVVQSGGRTIAVIGSGIDVIYPPENSALLKQIRQKGMILSEYEMGTKPDAGNFPRRNRIISGISIGTVIIETGPDGGAMITASTAFDQNREVFALPSAIRDRSRSGTNLLIKQGKAMLVESVEDVIVELAPRLKHFLSDITTPPCHTPSLSLFEQQVVDAMDDDPVHIDVLAERAGLTTSDSLVHLLSLEFKGVVKQLPGKLFRRS